MAMQRASGFTLQHEVQPARPPVSGRCLEPLQALTYRHPRRRSAPPALRSVTKSEQISCSTHKRTSPCRDVHLLGPEPGRDTASLSNAPSARKADAAPFRLCPRTPTWLRRVLLP